MDRRGHERGCFSADSVRRHSISRVLPIQAKGKSNEHLFLGAGTLTLAAEVALAALGRDRPATVARAGVRNNRHRSIAHGRQSRLVSVPSRSSFGCARAWWRCAASGCSFGHRRALFPKDVVPLRHPRRSDVRRPQLIPLSAVSVRRPSSTCRRRGIPLATAAGPHRFRRWVRMARRIAIREPGPQPRPASLGKPHAAAQPEKVFAPPPAIRPRGSLDLPAVRLRDMSDYPEDDDTGFSALIKPLRRIHRPRSAHGGAMSRRLRFSPVPRCRDFILSLFRGWSCWPSFVRGNWLLPS